MFLAVFDRQCQVVSWIQATRILHVTENNLSITEKSCDFFRFHLPSASALTRSETPFSLST